RSETRDAPEDDRVRGAIPERGEKPQPVAFERPAERAGILLAVERRPSEPRDDAAVEGRRQPRERVVTEVEPGGAVQIVPPSFGYDVDRRRRRAPDIGREGVGDDLKILHPVLREILERTAHDVVVVVRAVNGDGDAASELTRG